MDVDLKIEVLTNAQILTAGQGPSDGDGQTGREPRSGKGAGGG